MSDRNETENPTETMDTRGPTEPYVQSRSKFKVCNNFDILFSGIFT